MSLHETYIVDGIRTPIGRYGGALSGVRADDLGAIPLKALMARPEVLEAHRLAGDIDYILKVRVKNARAYDTFYQALISEVRIYNVTALLSMEEIKATTILPL